MTNGIPYKRVLLKISGEMLIGPQKFGIQLDACRHIAHCLNSLREAGIQVGVVIGGGNIFRGVNHKDMGMAQSPADQMGMLATMINGIALEQALQNEGIPAKLMTALDCPKVAESYNWQKAQQYLAEDKILIFVGGTGNPYFTTDTAAALRASEIQADVMLKATKVNGVYNKDPLKYSDAVKYDTITYSKVLSDNLEIMDATSVALCRRSKIPILVFNMNLLEKEKILDALMKKNIGTLIQGD